MREVAQPAPGCRRAENECLQVDEGASKGLHYQGTHRGHAEKLERRYFEQGMTFERGERVEQVRQAEGREVGQGVVEIGKELRKPEGEHESATCGCPAKEERGPVHK
jgi:hypothetical protein